jgi:hypothetical protein
MYFQGQMVFTQVDDEVGEGGKGGGGGAVLRRAISYHMCHDTTCCHMCEFSCILYVSQGLAGYPCLAVYWTDYL